LAPHFSILDSTFFFLDSIFWLDSTLDSDFELALFTSSAVFTCVYIGVGPWSISKERRWLDRMSAIWRNTATSDQGPYSIYRIHIYSISTYGPWSDSLRDWISTHNYAY